MRVMAFLIGCFISVTSAFAGDEGLFVVYDTFQDEKRDAGKPTTTQEWYVAGQRMRIEPTMMRGKPIEERQSSYSIFDGRKKRMVVVMNAQKSYMEMDLNSSSPSSGTEANRGKIAEVAEFERTGEKKQVGGFDCEVWRRVTATQRDELCLAAGQGEWFSLWQQQSKAGEQTDCPILPDLKGIPAEIRSTKLKNNRTFVMRAREHKRMQMTAELFSVPTGYKKMEMPQMADMEKMQEAAKAAKAEKPRQPTAVEQETTNLGKEVGSELKNEAKSEAKQNIKKQIKGMLPW